MTDDLTERLLDHGGNLGGADDGLGIRWLKPVKDDLWADPSGYKSMLGPPPTEEEARATATPPEDEMFADTKRVLGADGSDKGMLGVKRTQGIKEGEIEHMTLGDAVRMTWERMSPSRVLSETAQSVVEGLTRAGAGAARTFYGKDFTMGDMAFIARDAAGAGSVPDMVGAFLRPMFGEDKRLDHKGPTMAQFVELLDRQYDYTTTGQHMVMRAAPYVLASVGSVFSAGALAGALGAGRGVQVLAGFLADRVSDFTVGSLTEIPELHKVDPSLITVIHQYMGSPGGSMSERAMIELMMGALTVPDYGGKVAALAEAAAVSAASGLAVKDEDSQTSKRLKRGFDESLQGLLGEWLIRSFGGGARAIKWGLAAKEVADAVNKLDPAEAMVSVGYTHGLIQHQLDMGSRRWGNFLEDVYDGRPLDLSKPRDVAVMNVRANIVGAKVLTGLTELRVMRDLASSRSATVDERLRFTLPQARRVTPDWTPQHPEYGRYLDVPEEVLDRPVGALNVTEKDAAKFWREALAESAPRARERAAASGFKAPAADILKAMERMPARSRWFYERGGEAVRDGIEVDPRTTLFILDLLGTTSPKSEPRDNMLRTLAVTSQYLRREPIDVDLMNPAQARDPIARASGEAGGGFGGNKTQAFTDTFAATLGLTKEFPHPVNDVWQARFHGAQAFSGSNDDAVHEPMALFMVKMRDHINARLPEGATPFEAWQLQAVAWAAMRSRELSGGLPLKEIMGDFASVLDDFREIVAAAGLPLGPGGKITRETLTDGRFAALARGNIESYRAAEINETNTEIGRRAAETYKKALAGGNEKAAAEYENNIARVMYNMRRGETAPFALLAKALTGSENYRFTRVESGTSGSSLDVSGTFEGAVSPNLVVPMRLLSSGRGPIVMRGPEIESVLQVAGYRLRQTAMAASNFSRPIDGVVPDGAILSRAVFVHTTKQLDRDALVAFAKALPDGYNATVIRRANGYEIGVHPKFGDAGPEPIQPDALAKAAGETLGDFEATVLPMVYRSTYTEISGDAYAKARGDLMERFANEETDKIADRLGGIDRAEAARIVKGDRRSARGGGILAEARNSYRRRLAYLDDAEAAFERAHNDIIERSRTFLEKWEGREQPRARAQEMKGGTFREDAEGVQVIEWSRVRDRHYGTAIDADSGREVYTTISEIDGGHGGWTLERGKLDPEHFDDLAEAKAAGEKWLKETYPNAFSAQEKIRERLHDAADLLPDVPRSQRGPSGATPGGKTAEGDPLVAPLVIGKRTPSGRPAAPTADQLAWLTLEMFQGGVATAKLPGARAQVLSGENPWTGAIWQQLVIGLDEARGLTRLDRKDIASLIKLDDQFRTTLMHEVGHGFANAAGLNEVFARILKYNGLGDSDPQRVAYMAQLKREIEMLSRRNRPELWSVETEEQARFLYSGSLKALSDYRWRPDELAADAGGQYQSNPRLTTRDAPLVASLLRRAVNRHPRFTKIVQLNEAGSGLILLGALMGLVEFEGAEPAHHEESITVEVDGRWVNLPTIFDGAKIDQGEAVRLYKRGDIEPLGGATYDTEPEASKAARRRSEDLGRGGR